MIRKIALIGLLSAAAQLHAAQLRVVSAGITNACLFATNCSVTVEDTTTDFTLPGNSGTGTLLVRTYVGDSNAPASNLYAYVFQIDLSAMAGTNCVQSLGMHFGPVRTDFDYDEDGMTGDGVFVEDHLFAAGDVSPDFATLSGNFLSIAFTNGLCPGLSSHFFGVVSSYAPLTNTAHINAIVGGALVSARLPDYPNELVFANLRDFITGLSDDSLAGRNTRAKNQRRRALLVLVNNAERLSHRRYGLAASRALLRAIARRTDGLRADWVLDDAATPDNEPAQLLDLVQQATDSLTR